LSAETKTPPTDKTQNRRADASEPMILQEDFVRYGPASKV